MSERFILNTDFLIRVDKTETIKSQFDENYVAFGCPANWIDYAKKQADGIADKYEGICGHVNKNDPRLSMICDDGIPLNMFRSLWNEEGPNDTVYVRYIFHCLTPTLCFYSVLVKEDLKRKRERIDICLKDYYSSLGLDQEECSILVIFDVDRFFSELRQQIPYALMNNRNIDLSGFDSNCVLLAEMVKYTLNLDEEFFNIRSLKDIYRKLPKYSPQNEARLIIPDAHFRADPVYNTNAYRENRLIVNVPKLKEYSVLLDAKSVNYILCGDYSKENNDFGISFCKTK